jgi:hypothetical protein
MFMVRRLTCSTGVRRRIFQLSVMSSSAIYFFSRSRARSHSGFGTGDSVE